LPERNVTTFDCHASQPVALLDPSILEESEQWILGSWQVAVANFVVLKISEQTQQMQLRFLLINPDIKTMKQVTAQIINRCLSHHIS
jgi:hypothetical protein